MNKKLFTGCSKLGCQMRFPAVKYVGTRPFLLWRPDPSQQSLSHADLWSFLPDNVYNVCQLLYSPASRQSQRDQCRVLFPSREDRKNPHSRTTENVWGLINFSNCIILREKMWSFRVFEVAFIVDENMSQEKNHNVAHRKRSHGWLLLSSLPGLWLEVASKHLLVHLQLLLPPLLKLQITFL